MAGAGIGPGVSPPPGQPAEGSGVGGRRLLGMPGSVIVAGARTPIGKLSGALASFSAAELGAIAIRSALERAATLPEEVDYVIMGQVLLAGTGQVPARQAATAAGIPMTTPATIVNKVCLSGLNAIYQADLMIQAGDAEVVVAGGMESMTAAPHLLLGARQGYRIGDAVLHDAMMYDGLKDAHSHQAMGLDSEHYLPQFPAVTRERQDAFAADSHERAARAAKDGLFADEITAVEVPQRKGDPIVVTIDEGVRPGTTAESLAGLRPAFATDGSITAGNASQISDGASALIVMSEAAAERHGVQPLGRVVSYGMVAGPDTCLMTQPSRSTVKALDKVGLGVADVVGVRVQRGLRRGGPGLHRRPEPAGRHRQPQRRSGGAGPPHRRIRQPPGPDPAARAAAAGRRGRRRRPVRRRRPRRRAGSPDRLISPMHVAVIGAGAIGAVVAAAGVDAGHDVTVCVRTPIDRLILESDGGERALQSGWLPTRPGPTCGPPTWCG